ncbi:MAG: hypothetical protein ACOZBW_05265, partial [Thermodesulfobacteriota bacterium]
MAGGLVLSSSSTYDTAGRVATQTGPDGLTTTYGYADGGRTTTVTRPTGSEVSERYIDGRTRSVTGTAVVAQYYTYGVNPDGTQWTEVRTTAPDSPAWQRTTSDLLGRTVKTESPGASGEIMVARNYYDAMGRLVRATTPGQADTLYTYDELGQQVATGLDVDANGVLEPASMDRITATHALYEKSGNQWWQTAEQITYAQNNSAAPVTLAIQKTQVSGLGVNNKAAESVSIDMLGNITRSQTFIDRANKTETRRTDYPDSDTPAEQVTVNGLLALSKTKTGLVYAFDYDALGRQTGMVDPRTGESLTHYNDKGRVDYVEDAAGNRITYVYDPATGRKTAEVNADNQATYYAYNAMGQVVRTWGPAAYSVEYVYDDYGRMTQMRTFRSGDNWEAETWPSGASGDTTTWLYDPATGLLAVKTDALGNAVSYTYDTAGRLKTRTWARTAGGSPVVTTYNYAPATGDLTGIDYSGATADVTFAYDRMGRQTHVTDAVGSRTFAYNDHLQLESESITGLYGKTITRAYDSLGRSTGFTAGPDHAMTYAYDAFGRFKTAAWNIRGQSDAATYGYAQNADLLSGYATTGGHMVSYTYEDHRNLKTGVQNAFNTALVSGYTYQYDNPGQRTNTANTGQAFAQPGFNVYDYNTRSEVTGSERYEGTDVTDLSMPIDPERRLYAYDPIGNRDTAAEGTDP